ncbi:hypothetical protein COLO4_23385 [Corchorus olitorius]|uniref:Desiccation-related protein PCC13-62-like protein n=1 Tax=Corchorus olitorius TaxID=93759 RepID=A0A1R3IH05_9ROSI|nr:hypothetical protein COLO4_23385 [Corchorus olitorius]
MASRSCLYAYFLLLLVVFQSTSPIKGNSLPPPQCRRVLGTSSEVIQFLLNFLYLEANLYLYASTGHGIDAVAPGLIQGPAPIGAQIANLDATTRKMIEEFGLENVGIIRAIFETKQVNPIQGPLLNLSVEALGGFANAAFNAELTPTYNTYATTINFLPAIAAVNSFIRQYCVGMLPHLANDDLQVLGTKILGTVSARFGALRTLLYLNANVIVSPYHFDVATLVDRIAQLVNRLAMCGVKDEGLIVALQLGAENRTTTNVIPGDVNSLAFSRTEREMLRGFYGTGNATLPGGIFPHGVNGELAEEIVRERLS